ncbi:MAG: hypothetical protein AB1629_06235 [Candidatus Omnitrophota bacterium]
MFSDISKQLILYWQEYFPDQEAPSSLYPLFARGDKWNMLFIFSDKSLKPKCAIEIAHGRNELLRSSANNLRDLNKNLQLAPFCPQFIYFGCLGSDDMFIQEACDGTPLLFLLQQKLGGVSSKKHYIGIATDLLIKLHSLSISKYIFLDSNTLGDFFGSLLALSKDNGSIRGIVSSIKNKRLPLVLSHNDFIPANILINKNELKILDWEYANFEGLPLTDLCNFLLWAYRDISRREVPPEGFIKDVFFSNCYLGDAVKKSIKSYCQALVIDKNLALAIFLQWLLAEFKDDKLVESLISKPLECFNI